MDQETRIAFVKRAWARVSRRDFNVLLDLLAPEVTWRIPNIPAVPFAGTLRGREGMREFFQTEPRPRKRSKFAPEAFIAKGQTVVVLGSFVNRVTLTGKTARSA